MYMLRPLLQQDVPYMLEWMHDSLINKHFRFDASKQTKETVSAFINNSFTSTEKHFAITDDSNIYLGTISLKNIDNENSTAEYAICMRSCAQGTGAAHEATQLILRKAFFDFNLNRVYLNVLSDNFRAQKFYIKAGFCFEGEFVQHFKINSRWRNIKWYAILKSNFLEVNNHEFK